MTPDTLRRGFRNIVLYEIPTTVKRRTVVASTENQPRDRSADHLTDDHNDNRPMFGIETLGGDAQAAALVAAVLLEALALNLGYGALSRLAGPSVTNAVQGE